MRQLAAQWVCEGCQCLSGGGAAWWLVLSPACTETPFVSSHSKSGRIPMRKRQELGMMHLLSNCVVLTKPSWPECCSPFASFISYALDLSSWSMIYSKTSLFYFAIRVYIQYYFQFWVYGIVVTRSCICQVILPDISRTHLASDLVM